MTVSALAPAASASGQAPRLTVLDGGEGERGPTSGQIRVVLVHGHALVRAGIRGLLEEGSGISVVAEAAGPEHAALVVRRLRPDVVLLDADVGDPDVDAIREIAELGPPVVVLGAADADVCLPWLRVGASAVLVHDTEPEELLRAVHLVARGHALVSPSLTRDLISELVSRPDPLHPSSELLDELTAREREVVALVALGLKNDEIAERLVVSPATARTHVSRAMVKVAARDRAQLVVFAYQAGLVQA
jgi:DNA-binding NarL/FixJ family response regulator